MNNEFIVKGNHFNQCRINTLDFEVCRNEYSIIKGVVYDKNNKPVEGAIITVVEIGSKSYRKLLGRTFTDECGRYLIGIKPKEHKLYEIIATTPM